VDVSFPLQVFILIVSGIIFGLLGIVAETIAKLINITGTVIVALKSAGDNSGVFTVIGNVYLVWSVAVCLVVLSCYSFSFALAVSTALLGSAMVAVGLRHLTNLWAIEAATVVVFLFGSIVQWRYLRTKSRDIRYDPLSRTKVIPQSYTSKS